MKQWFSSLCLVLFFRSSGAVPTPLRRWRYSAVFSVPPAWVSTISAIVPPSPSGRMATLFGRVTNAAAGRHSYRPALSRGRFGHCSTVLNVKVSLTKRVSITPISVAAGLLRLSGFSPANGTRAWIHGMRILRHARIWSILPTASHPSTDASARTCSAMTPRAIRGFAAHGPNCGVRLAHSFQSTATLTPARRSKLQNEDAAVGEAGSFT